MLISVENGRTMILSNNIIPLIFLCVTNTWARSQVDLESNNLNEGNYGVKLLDNNDVYSSLFKNNLRDRERVFVQLYYEVFCPHCINFELKQFAHVVETMGPYLDIDTYPFGNAKIIDNNGTVEFKCQHGPAECYGNKLHACAIHELKHTTALLYNTCLMNSTDGLGSDDKSADRCGKLMNVNSEPIKACAKGILGKTLLYLFGRLSQKANFLHVPHVLINGKQYHVKDNDFKTHVCAAFTKPPPPCTNGEN